MHGYYGMATMGWGAMVLWLGLAVGVVVAAGWALRRAAGGSGGGSSVDAEEILKRRFARGEIDSDEYEHRLAELRRE